MGKEERLALCCQLCGDSLIFSLGLGTPWKQALYLACQARPYRAGKTCFSSAEAAANICKTTGSQKVKTERDGSLSREIPRKLSWPPNLMCPKSHGLWLVGNLHVRQQEHL